MQHMIRILVVALAGLATAAAAAADRPVSGPVPDWVEPAPAQIAAGASSGTPVQVLLSDQQVRLSPTAVETYFDSRVRIQTPQGLQALGTIALAWQPDNDTITVHRLSVRRGPQVRDLMGNGDAFTVLRREDMLEQATLTGTLTAIMQPPDLQVGDTIEFAYTRRHADPVVPDRPEMQLGWSNAPIQNVRFRATWPKQMALRWQLRDFKPALKETTSGGNQSIAFTLESPAPLLQPTGAPARYLAMRRLQLTSFQSWAETSRRLAPLYTEAAKLAKDSPLHAEIERIRKASSDPKQRAAAALQLAQDQVRYVLLAMNEGALVPATADQTWQRRYGDCKAKTALLLALLHGLDIEAEPVAVNTGLGDGIDQQLPAIGVFNHVLVRAQLAGKTYWLDGTRLGDRKLDLLQVPDFRWGLPLNARGSELLRIEAAQFTEPQTVSELDIDASTGIDKAVPMRARLVMRGDDALGLKQMHDALEASQRQQAMRDYWRDQLESPELEKMDARFDEATGELTWTAEGRIQLDWTDDGFHELEDMRFGYKADFSRPTGADTDAPYAVNYPRYSLMRASVRLPKSGRTEFSVSGDDIHQTVAGVEYNRKAAIENGVFRAEASMRSVMREFPARDAPAAEKALRELYKEGLFIYKTEQQSSAREYPSEAELLAQAGKPLKTAQEYIDRAAAMMFHNLYGPAIVEFTRAIELDPKSISALSGRGFAHDALDHFAQAREDFDAALKIDPQNAFMLGNLAGLELGQGHDREAARLLEAALKIEEDFSYRGMLASARIRLGEFEQALADLEVLRKTKPTEPISYTMRATALMKMDRREAASRVADEVLAARVGPADGMAVAASIYFTTGEADKARPMLDAALAKAPSVELYISRASFTENATDGIHYLDAALKLDPKSIPALTRLAPIQLQDRRYADLLVTLDKLDALTPPSLRLMRTRGEALVKLGRIEAARTAYARVRAVSKQATDFNSLCWSEVTSSDALLDEALKDCASALAMQPTTSAYLDSRGLVLLKLKRYEEAIESYDASLKDRPKQVGSLFGRGVARLRLGRTSAGEADIKAAMNMSPDVEQQFAGYGVER